MVSWTIRTARSLSSTGCWCPDPCLGVCCFGADMGYILPKNAASIKPRAVQSLFFVGAPNSKEVQASLFMVNAQGGHPKPLLPVFDRSVMVGKPAYPGAKATLTPDGAAILFCARMGGCTHLFKTPIHGSGPPVALVAGADTVVQGLSTGAHSNVAAVVVATSDN